MESCSNQKKELNKTKCIFYLRFFKVATLCLDSLCTLLAFTKSASPGMFFKWSWRSSHILLSTCWLLFLHSAVQIIPNHLSWVEVGGLWRSGYLMQHSITLILGKIALTQPGGVLGHCPVEKHMIVPLSSTQMGWRVTAECCGCHAG